MIDSVFQTLSSRFPSYNGNTIHWSEVILETHAYPYCAQLIIESESEQNNYYEYTLALILEVKETIQTKKYSILSIVQEWRTKMPDTIGDTSQLTIEHIDYVYDTQKSIAVFTLKVQEYQFMK